MAPRPKLHELLKSFVGPEGEVYFQPPPSVKMVFPCIIYQRSNVDIRYANNLPYKHKTRYQITIVDRDPDSDIHAKVAALPMCSYDRFYTADNLNHDVYTLYF